MRTLFYTAFLLVLPIVSMAQSTEKNGAMLPKLYNDNGDNFIVIAHRGASAYYPENTMAAFRGAVEMDAEMIELDLMMSKDGVPVVFHDPHLNTHTNGKGLVSDLTVKQLKKLDAGSWFDEKFAGQQIHTLEEVITFAAGKIALNIEIKSEAVTDELKGGVEEKSLALVKKYGMEEYVLFSSFDYRAVQHLKELDPTIPVAILYEKRQSQNKLPSELISEYNADAFNCSYRQLSKKWMENLNQNHIPFFIYTVDKEFRMRKLIELGVSGIFTNKPDVLRSVINNLNRDKRDENH